MSDKYIFGIIGLGTMGRNLLLNMADHNFMVAGHDKDQSKIDLLSQEAKGKTNVKGFVLVNEFIESLLLKNPKTAPQDFGNDDMAIQRAKAVFKVLKNHIAIGEVKDIVAQLPAEIGELWRTPGEYREQYSV